jgi:hypothetical protein
MQERGAVPFEDRPADELGPGLRPLSPGDAVVIAHENAMPPLLDPRTNPRLDYFSRPITAGMATMSGGAGFYSHFWGLIPFVIGRPPPEDFAVYLFTGAQNTESFP